MVANAFITEFFLLMLLQHGSDMFKIFPFVQGHFGLGRPFCFLRWNWEQLDEEEVHFWKLYRKQYEESELVVT